MGLLDIFQRKAASDTDAASTPAPAADAVQAARTRARRRLIGAAVLLAAGIIGFPLLFETQPRPIAVDIPIVIPSKDKAPPLVLKPAPAASVLAEAAAPVEPVASEPLVERAGEQGREVVAVPAPTPAPASKPAAKPEPAASKPAARPEPAASKPAARPEPAASKPATADADARIVVQVGAYTDATKLREARAKVEKMGLKTYTQVVEVDGSKRTRVRVGPFASKAEADKAAARLKAAGLPAAILSL